MAFFKRNNPKSGEADGPTGKEKATLVRLAVQANNVPGSNLPPQLPESSLNQGVMINWKRLGSVALFSFVCVAAVSFILLWQFGKNVVLEQPAGEIALDDVLAPKNLIYNSAAKTKELGDAAANNSANKVYKRDILLIANQREALNSLLNQIDKTRANPQDAGVLQSAAQDGKQITTLLNLPDSVWSTVNQETRNVFNFIMSRDILPEELNGSVEMLNKAVKAPYNISGSFALLDETNRAQVIELVKAYVRPNNVLDEAATAKKQSEARKSVGQVEVTLLKGATIVHRGDVLSPFQVEQLKELGLSNSNFSFNQVVGTVGVTAMLVLLLVLYCTLLAGSVWNSWRWPLFLAVSLIVTTIVMRLLLTNSPKDSTVPYLLPLATVAMVLAALYDVNLALFLSGLLAILAGMVSGSPELVAVFFAGSAAGALTLRRAEHTSFFAYAAIAVAGAQFVVGLCANLWLHGLLDLNIFFLLLSSLLNGLISASLAFFCFSVLGKLFGVATVLQLLELAHPNQPLLRRLIREAPGTYHHSVMVSNLAEQAAERLDDNALLARVGAYYHDIGKLARPTYFIDNQGGGANIHDTLDPRESARIIRAHVSDGVALARKHKLPRRVVDVIEQHHGTCTISFFYQKAIKMGLDVSEMDFRYPGPKPQTKIAALVMLADGCEAAVRANVQSGRILTGSAAAVPTAQHPTGPDAPKYITIRDVVNKIIDDRIRENQLSECDLTLRDIEEVRNLFVELLTGIYHPRISYPDKDPVPTNQKETEVVVNGSAREVQVAIVPAAPEPVHHAVTLGAADGGSTVPLSNQPNNHDAQPDTKKLNPGSPSGIGGAGKRISEG